MFTRQYVDEDTITEIKEEEVRYRLEGYYNSIDLAIECMKQGIPHRTNFAIYRWINISE